MEKNIPTYQLIIDDSVDSDLQVDFIAMVDAPAIEKNWMAFREEFADHTAEIENLRAKEQAELNSKIPNAEQYTVNGKVDRSLLTNKDDIKTFDEIYNKYDQLITPLLNKNFAATKVSIDYDDTLSTDRGKQLAKKLIDEGVTLYIISARAELTGMLQIAKDLGIPESRVYATGSNKAKVEKIKELGITKHYDNNSDVVKELGSIGHKFLSLSFQANDQKQELFGPAMLANIPIYRNDSQLGEYNVVFNKDTIYKIAQKYFEKGYQSNLNLMHDPMQKVTDVFVFQSYIVDNAEGRPAPKGFEDAQDGSWFIGVKVNNPEVWAKVKTGEIKGFSVEGVFEYKKKEISIKELYEEIQQLISNVK